MEVYRILNLLVKWKVSGNSMSFMTQIKAISYHRMPLLCNTGSIFTFSRSEYSLFVVSWWVAFTGQLPEEDVADDTHSVLYRCMCEKRCFSNLRILYCLWVRFVFCIAFVFVQFEIDTFILNLIVMYFLLRMLPKAMFLPHSLVVSMMFPKIMCEFCC